MATSMRKENAKGNTGMDHGIQTQDKSYNNYREEEGVINKLNVHKKTYLKKMMVLEGEQMKNANDQFLEVRANSAQDITSKNVSIKFKNFKELIEGRGSHRTLLSLERFLFIQLVYSCIDLEMSSILLCTDVPPRKGSRWVVVFKRFLLSSGEGMDIFRENCAKLAAHGRRKAKFAEGNEVKYISDVYSESIHYLNVHRMKFFLSQMTEQLILAEKKVNTIFYILIYE